MKSKIDAAKVLQGLQQKKSEAQIARDVGVHQSSVSRFLTRIKPYFQDLEEITANRGNIFNYLHSRSLKIQHSILDEVDRIIEENERKDHTKRMKLPSLLYCLRGIGMNQAVLYDKMRLEGGLSTENHSIAGLVHHAHHAVGPFDPATGEFKASVVGPKPISRPKKNDTSTTLVENESNQ